MIIPKKILPRLISIFLIAIFAFSITPVIVLHNFFADHSDTVIFHHHTKTNEVAKAGIDCHIDSFVAERNFIVPFTQIKFDHFLNFSPLSDKYILAFYFHHQLFAELRGPPVKT